MLPVEFAHMGFNCQDPIAMEKFYAKYFGFKRVRVIPIDKGQIVFIRSGTITLELFSAEGERPTPLPEKDGYTFPGWRHISFKVENVDAKLAEMGTDARITFGPFDFDQVIPGWRTVWVADPEGNIIEISQGYVDEDNPPPLD
jgi:glyoxylase I family protein